MLKPKTKRYQGIPRGIFATCQDPRKSSCRSHGRAGNEGSGREWCAATWISPFRYLRLPFNSYFFCYLSDLLSFIPAFSCFNRTGKPRRRHGGYTASKLQYETRFGEERERKSMNQSEVQVKSLTTRFSSAAIYLAWFVYFANMS